MGSSDQKSRSLSFSYHMTSNRSNKDKNFIQASISHTNNALNLITYMCA